jgi:4a-hydroxytetrahydrobiopterin dehydratase
MPIFKGYNEYLRRFENQTHLNKWGFDNNSIYRIFEFKDFKGAITFINSVAQMSEQTNHHPDIQLYDYKFVKISFKTHDQDKVTMKDYKAAHIVDEIYDGENL